MLIVFTFKNKLIFNADTCIKLCDIHAKNIQYYSRYLRYIKKFMLMCQFLTQKFLLVSNFSFKRIKVQLNYLLNTNFNTFLQKYNINTSFTKLQNILYKYKYITH